MIRKMLVLAGVVLGMVCLGQAQPPDTLWTRTFGGSSYDVGFSGQQTTDGGYIISGQTNAGVYLIKTNALGDTIWTRAFGGTVGYSVQQTSDGGYVITGNMYGANGYDVYLIKTSALGDTIWTRTFGGSNNDYGNSVQQTSDSGYIIAGSTASYGAGSLDVYLIKTNADGNLTWQRTFGGSMVDKGYSVRQTMDGGYIIAGETSSYGAGANDVYLIKTDTNGNRVWQRTYGGSSNEEGYSVKQTTDGGYIITGATLSYGSAAQVYLIKTDNNGHEIWQSTFGRSGDDCGRSVQQTTDGGYVISGFIFIISGNTQVYLIKTDTNGDSTWTRTFGGSSYEDGNSVQQTTDGGYIVVGQTMSYGAGWYDVYLIKTNAGGSSLHITMTPVNPPITIPANGGSFQFDASVQRTQAPQAPFYVWARDRYPDGTYTGNLLGPVQINPPVGITVTRQRTQVVPGSWPAGVHYYIGYAHTTVSYPATDADSFSWTKLTTVDGGATVWEAVNYGEPFPGEELAAGEFHSSSFILHPSSPNPFNPSTVLSYELRVPSQVSLKVYDTTGRLVASLVDGWRQAGEHSVTFDGSKLAAGVYLMRLEASGSGTTPTTATGKMVLLK